MFFIETIANPTATILEPTNRNSPANSSFQIKANCGRVQKNDEAKATISVAGTKSIPKFLFFVLPNQNAIVGRITQPDIAISHTAQYGM